MNTRLHLLCIPVLVLAAGLLCVNLGSKPFWVDESIAVLPARAIHAHGVPKSTFDLDYMAFQLEDGLWDPSAPLYRYVVAGVTAVTGFDETTTRGVSVAFALLALLACFQLFARTDGRPTAWLAVTLLAASWMFVEHAREARHFTFVLCAMVTCLMLLERAEDDPRARVLWPVALVAAVLGHAIGYLLVPVVAAWLAAGGPRRVRAVLSREGLPVYLATAALYAAVIARYWRTLPFVHEIGCGNRTIGCEPDPFYYLGTLQDFLRGGPGGGGLWDLLAPGPWLFAIGVVLALQSLRRNALYLLWLALPVVALSLQELKFPRYLFYVLPVVALFVARGLLAVAALPALRRVPVAAALALVVLAAPQVVVTGQGTTLYSSAAALARSVLDAPSDNWDHIRAKTDYLRAHLRDGDVVVATVDDASLGYYLGHFVYSFVNSSHDDAFFLALLADAARREATVWLVDDLPAQNHCHTPMPELHNVDCRTKYAGFWSRCDPSHSDRDPHCQRVSAR